MLTYRILPFDERGRLPAEIPLNQEIAWPVVAEKDGQIVGCWVVMPVLHAEPVWVSPNYRGHPTLLRRLSELVKSVARELGAKRLFGIIPNDNPNTIRLAQHLEGEEYPGRLFQMETT